MKINVSLDLDGFYAGDEYHGTSIDEAIIDAVSESVTLQLKEQIDERIKKIFDKALEREVSDVVAKLTSDTLALGIQPMTMYGEPTGERVPFKKYLIDRVDTILKGKVDRDGRPATGYSSDYQNVVEWAVKRLAVNELERLTTSIKADVEKAINAEIKSKIIADVVPAITKALIKL